MRSGDYVTYEPYGYGTGIVTEDLGEGRIRVRFPGGEVTVRPEWVTSATEQERALAVTTGITPDLIRAPPWDRPEAAPGRAANRRGLGMICARCDQPIRPGEPYTTQVEHGGSGAAPDTHAHDACPQPPSRTPPRHRAADRARDVSNR
ncbi:hypothetical protein ACFWM0_16375 [Streptomyces sp. NPDC058405]|uniref:hypothetical protein n=1 Tax=Streptomyces sp. NPDC058405 TaxID=3346482 RepID=UPI003658D897